MKISINSALKEGPYGGGEKFSNYLRDYLINKGEEVINDLGDNDIDLILHINPIPFLNKASAYSLLDAYAYKLKHPETIIIHRINECDERKNTHHINRLLGIVASCSDYVVYIAHWLRPLLIHWVKPSRKCWTVILNGADTSIFNSKNKKLWDGKEKMKIVTHHWSNNYLKGHDIYQKLDGFLDKKEFKDKFEFTYIGNYPADLKYVNTNMILPLAGKELAEELKRHHVYLTASRNEPAGMHHIEGALCGLPLLYIDSGALPEYCRGYGIKFNESNFKEKLVQMRREYYKYVPEVRAYNRTALIMAREYYGLFKKLYKKRGQFKVKGSIFLKKFFLFFNVLFFFLIFYLLKIRKICTFIKNKRSELH